METKLDIVQSAVWTVLDSDGTVVATSTTFEPHFSLEPGTYTVSVVFDMGNGATQNVIKTEYITIGEILGDEVSSSYLASPVSYSFGFSDNTGHGWSENSGEHWILPANRMSLTKKMVNGTYHIFAWDWSENKQYMLSDSSSVSLKPVYYDKAIYPVACEVVTHNIHPSSNDMSITHEQTSVMMMPTDHVYEPDFELDVSILNEDDVILETKTDVNPENEVVFYHSNNKTERDRTLKVKLHTNHSGFVIKNVHSIFKAISKFNNASSPERDDMAIFVANMTLWVTRGNYGLNRASGTLLYTMDGDTKVYPDFEDAVFITGPDQMEYSGITIGNNFVIPYEFVGTEGNLLFWSTNTILTISGVPTIHLGTLNQWILYGLEIDGRALVFVKHTPLFDIRILTIGSLVDDDGNTSEMIVEYMNNLERYLPGF